MYWCSRVLLLAAVTVCASSSTAVTPLQAAIDAAIASGASSYSLDPGATYQQGNASLVIRASSFAVHGNGATLVFFPTAGVLIDGSSDVAVTDLTVTYSPRCFTQGAVVAYDAQHNTIDVKLDAGFPTPDAPWFTSTVETKLQFFDGATRLRSLGQSGSCIVNVASSPSPGVWRVAVASGFRCSVPPLAGLLATISPRVNAPAYQIPQGYVGGAWWVFNSSRVLSQSVTLHGSGNFAFTEWGGEGAHIYRDVVLGREGTNLLSSNTDGFHSFSTGTGPRVERARLSFMGDDVLNIHNRVGLVLAVTGASSLRVIDVGDTPTPALDPSAPSRALADVVPGDVLRLSSPRGDLRGAPSVARFVWSTDSSVIAAARAYVAARPDVAVNPAGVGVWEAVFAAPLPTGIVPGDIVQFDRRASMCAVVINSTFTDAYDSCFRLQASGALVSGNTWLRIPGGVSVVFDPAWLEGASDIRDVALDKNHFRAIGNPPATMLKEILHVDGNVVNFTAVGNTVTVS